MRRANIAAPDFTHPPELPDGFRPGIARFGALLDPEEDWLLVLDGRPTLRHPGGEDELQPWDVVLFLPGPGGAHAVRNETDSTARVLMFSDASTVAASVYPDSDKIAIWTGNDADDIIVKRTSGVGYWDGETGNRRREAAVAVA